MESKNNIGNNPDEPIEVQWSSGGKPQDVWFVSSEKKSGGPPVEEACVLRVVNESAGKSERQRVLQLVATYRAWHRKFIELDRRRDVNG